MDNSDWSNAVNAKADWRIEQVAASSPKRRMRLPFTANAEISACHCITNIFTMGAFNMDDFEELAADMLGITDDQRDKDVSIVEEEFFQRFDMDLEQGYKLARWLLRHTPIVEAGLSGKRYHAFVSKSGPFMLMKAEAATNSPS